MWKLIPRYVGEFFSEDPVEVIHIFWIDGDEFYPVFVVLAYLPFHGSHVAVSDLFIIGVYEAPIFDVYVVVGEVEVWVADVFVG